MLVVFILTTFKINPAIYWTHWHIFIIIPFNFSFYIFSYFLFQNYYLPPHQLIPLVSHLLNQQLILLNIIFHFFNSLIFLKPTCQHQKICTKFVILFLIYRIFLEIRLGNDQPYYPRHIHYHILIFQLYHFV